MAATEDQTKAVWRSRLRSALRTTLACSIVGVTALYSPKPVRRFITYPAFSYVTTVLIVSDANVGDTFRGFWHVLYATVQVMLISVLSLWLIGPARFTPGLAAAAVALSSFVVAIPESTHLMSKRIAFGQIVIVFVGATIQGASTHVVMHPVHVALSTALGAFASVLALLLPYPRLACSQVRKTCRMYAENAAERLKYCMEAFSSDDSSVASELISQAMSYSRIGDKLLQRLKANEDGMLWEKPEIRFLRPNYMHVAERLQQLELPLRGMEMALTSCSSFPIPMVDEELGSTLTSLKGVIGQKLEQAKCFAQFDTTTVPETKEDSVESLPHALGMAPTSHDLPALFFLFCMELLRRDLPINQTAPIKEDNYREFDINVSNNPKDPGNGSNFTRIWSRSNIRPSNQNLVFALKCSISLGFAVLFGLIYNKHNGYWSGLTIAISFATGRQATFTVANARAQGTAMGSVYGILGCFIFKRFMDLRLLPILPWVIFASFLRHSRMYGQAGGVSAVIGALLILGRTNYTTPTDFAIARITEATIGLICFVAVEILFEPARAATLARTKLSLSLGRLEECIEEIGLCQKEKTMLASTSPAFKEKLLQIKSHISEYETYTREAELEPNFWFHPFPASCYVALLESFSRMMNLLQFLAFEIDILAQMSPRIGFSSTDMQESLNTDMDLFKEKLRASYKCLEKVTSIKSLSKLDKELKKMNTVHDIELGKLPKAAISPSLCIAKEEADKITSSFLRNSAQVIEGIHAQEGDKDVKRQIVLCLGGIGFCIDKLMRETIIIEDTVKEVLKRENPLCHVNLSEISCKLDALRP